MALYDSLTGLPNRAYFMKKLSDTMNNQESVSLMFIDLDGFKKVNDQFGHDEGDTLLKIVAEILQDFSDSETFIGRLGGDEFVVLCKEANKEKMTEKANHILSSLQMQVNNIIISASIGVTFAQKDMTPKALLKQADFAMYQSKTEGKNAVYVD